MEWVSTLLAALVLVVLLAPLVMLLGTIFVLVPLAHIIPRPPMVTRASFDCPVSKRRVDVEFLASPEATRPSDVLSCSLFSDGRGIRCEKECLSIAETGWAPSPMVPRYSLLAGDEAFR